MDGSAKQDEGTSERCDSRELRKRPVSLLLMKTREQDTLPQGRGLFSQRGLISQIQMDFI